MPFGINYSVLILIWGICFFSFDKVKDSFRQIFNNKWSYLLYAFFILHILGFFYSDNRIEAVSAIEIKLSFFAFPTLIFSSNFNQTQVKKIIITFVSACILTSICCIFRALYLYVFYKENAFFYSDFSFFLHPSYMAMYLIFSQLIVLLFYTKWLAHLKFLKIKIGFISFVFLLAIFLCSSKMGLITALLLLPSTFFYIIYCKGYHKTILIFIFTFILGIAIAYKFFPSPFQRLKTALKVTSSIQTINKSDAESTAVRILIWKESINIIKENFWLGTSPGDANQALRQAYEKNGLTGALAKKLNAHNQYFQTFIGTGIFGFLLLMIITVFVIVYSFIKKNFILMLFSILISLNFMVESMLQSQAGFIFFTFFLCLLFKYNFKKLNQT
jgi:O-antigen ligase